MDLLAQIVSLHPAEMITALVRMVCDALDFSFQSLA